MAMFLLTIGCVVLIWLFNHWRIRRFVKLAYQIPSNKLNTWLGFGPLITKYNTVKIFNEHPQKYGKNSILWTGPLPFFYTSDPVSIRDIFKYSTKKPTLMMNYLHNTMGKGIMLINDEEWSVHRKLMNTAFAPKNLLSFITIFDKETDRMMQSMDDANLNGKNDTDMMRLFCELTFSTITQTVLKRKFEGNPEAITELNVNLIGAISAMLDLLFNIAWGFKSLHKLLEMTSYKNVIQDLKTVQKFIKDSVEIATNPRENDPNYVSKINGGIDYAFNGFKENKLTWQEMEVDVLHLYIAGFETTSNTLFLIIVLLAMHPEYQERAYEEISSILFDDDPTEMSIEKLSQMVYLDMIINEAMRVYPPVPQTVRCVHNGDLTLANGITLPDGQNILIDVYNLHRSKDVWGPEADKFNPDNFLPENMEARHSHAFVPFSQGTRICLGWKYALLSIKVPIAKLLKKYKFSTDFKYENLKIETSITFRFVEVPTVQVVRR